MQKWIVGALAGAWILAASGASAQLITPAGVAELRGFKAVIYNQITLQHAAEVAAGTAQPFVYTEVGGGDLPVSYYHYRVGKNRVAALAEALDLPAGFSLAPVRILRGQALHHYVSLTVYDSAGERSGLRAEWTTYVVKDGDPKPRVLMLEAWTSEGSFDPVDLHSDPVEVFEYTRDGDLLTTEIVAGGSSFSASFKIPPYRLEGKLDRSWNAASDVVYWRNGVGDLQNVNGLVSNRGVAPISGRFANADNQTPWAAFVGSRPVWVMVFDERIDVAIRPWFNVTDPSLPLDPAVRDELVDLKATVFSANEVERAAGIAQRVAEPMADFLVEETPPSIFLNFEILPDQIDALAEAIPMPDGFEIAPLEILEGTGDRYYLSLNIYDAKGLAPGFRAEWSIYVTNESDPIPRYMILDAQSSLFSLDPVNGFTMAADVFDYGIDSGVISVDVQAPGTSFQATVPVPANPVRRGSALDWTEANNLIYWRNGVADKIYYSGLVYDTDMIQVPTADVSIADATPFAPYIRLDHVLVFENNLEFIASPWNNLNELAEGN